jgi:predicted DNA-binding transcriptional regulator AlpA
MDNNVNERWLKRQELADRYGLPAKTLAQWASKGTGPRYARMGRHVRYRLSDVIGWETERIEDELRDADQDRVLAPHAIQPTADGPAQDANAGSKGATHDSHHL